MEKDNRSRVGAPDHPLIDHLAARPAPVLGVNRPHRYVAASRLYEPFNGFRLWADGDLGRIAGFKEGIMQFYTGSDGYLYAGDGAVILNVDGITVTGDELVKFLHNSTLVAVLGALAGNLFKISGGSTASARIGLTRTFSSLSIRL